MCDIACLTTVRFQELELSLAMIADWLIPRSEAKIRQRYGLSGLHPGNRRHHDFREAFWQPSAVVAE